MADWKPKSFVPDKPSSEWKPKSFVPDKSEQRPEPAKSVDAWTAAGRGAGQGATLGLGDEINGLVQALGERYLPESMGGGGELAQKLSLADLYRKNRDAFRRDNKLAEEEQRAAYWTGNIGASLPLGFAAGGGTAATLPALLKSGAALGATGGLGSSDADLTRGEYGGAAMDAALGGAVGLGATALGAGLAKGISAGAGVVSRRAGEKAARAAAEIAGMGKASAAEGTASARSAAGTSATAAYKNPTNIDVAIKAGAMTLDDLTPEQLALYRGLLRERAQKAAEEMSADAARKTAKGAEYANALATEEQRAMEAAKRIGDPMSQLGPRLKRYGAPLLGKAVGGLTGYELGDGDPLWAILGAGLGGAAGGFNRPMQHALMRMAQHPAMRRPMWNTLAGIARFAGPAADIAAPMSGQTGLALTPEVRAMIAPMLARNDEQETQRSLAAALRSAQP